MTVCRKLKRNIFIDTDINCQNCGCWQRVCTWNGECDNLEPMTNEEWLKSMNTEQFAEWIATQCGNAVMDSTYDVSKLRKKRYWVGWLKEIHHAN